MKNPTPLTIIIYRARNIYNRPESSNNIFLNLSLNLVDTRKRENFAQNLQYISSANEHFEMFLIFLTQSGKIYSAGNRI